MRVVLASVLAVLSVQALVVLSVIAVVQVWALVEHNIIYGNKREYKAVAGWSN